MRRWVSCEAGGAPASIRAEATSQTAAPGPPAAPSLSSTGNMSARPPRQAPAPEALRLYPAKARLDTLQDAVAHLHPLQRQHAVELHRQQQQQQVRASLSTFTACTVPASCRARSRFLNLRDSVKKSPTKSTAKVVGAGQRRTPWVPTSLPKVPPPPVPPLLLVWPPWMLLVAWW